MSLKSPDPVDRHVGLRVRLRRVSLGVSQEKLAEGLGLTFQQVQKYEKGINRIGGSRLAAIARLLGVSVGFFFEGTPGSGASFAATESPMEQFMASREGLVIADAFVRIRDPLLRAAIARFVRDVGRGGDVTEAMVRSASAANAAAANGAEPSQAEFDQSERNAT